MKNWIRFATLIAAVILGFLNSNSAQAAVWKEENQWSAEWEQKYSQWVKTYVTEDIFLAGPYAGLSTDCADAAYFIRAIFSHNNKLPFQVTNPATNKLFTNQTNAFDRIADDNQRLRTFLKAVADIVGTKSIYLDTYPVQINRTYVVPGIILSHMVPTTSGGTTGHIDIVHDLRDSGSIEFISSTVPSAVRSLDITYAIKSYPLTEEQQLGFRAWIWPQFRQQPVTTYPGYSLEQFYEGKTKSGTYLGYSGRDQYAWSDFIESRLRYHRATRADWLVEGIRTLCTMMKSRAGVVKASEEYKSKIGSRCMNASEYDAYSTPTRDQRIGMEISQFGMQFADVDNTGKINFDYLAKDFNKTCPAVTIMDGVTINLNQFISMARAGHFSSDPNDSVQARWGMAASVSRCQKY
jgi:hypothetical protein